MEDKEKQFEKLYKYFPNAVPAEETDRFYNAFKDSVRKDKDKFTIFGKSREEPRYKNFFSKDGHTYKYSGMENQSVGWTKELDELAEIAQQKIETKELFESALVNYYPDGKHYIGKHRDKDAMQGYIASFSFGEQRIFRIRHNSGNIYKDICMEDGSLLVMCPGFQEMFTHEVPKKAAVKDGRINVTMRQHQNLKRKTEKNSQDTSKKQKTSDE